MSVELVLSGCGHNSVWVALSLRAERMLLVWVLVNRCLYGSVKDNSSRLKRHHCLKLNRTPRANDSSQLGKYPFQLPCFVQSSGT